MKECAGRNQGCRKWESGFGINVSMVPGVATSAKGMYSKLLRMCNERDYIVQGGVSAQLAHSARTAPNGYATFP